MPNASQTRASLFLLLAFALPATSALAQADASPAEQALFQLANQARAQQSLPPLKWDKTLAHIARDHAQRMLSQPGDPQHQYPGEPDLLTRASQAGAHFTTVAENLADRGQSPAAIQQLWMTTPTHRANLLDPKLNAVGIAVIETNGLLTAVEDFAHNAPSFDRDAVEKNIAQLLLQHGISSAENNPALASSNVKEDARKTCQMSEGAAGSPKMVIQWDGPSPTDLPDALLHELSTGKYTSAAVGACPGAQPGNQPFTTVRVAVLLY